MHEVEGRPAIASAEERRRIIKAATDSLEASETLRDPNSRQVFLEELNVGLGSPLPIREAGRLRSQLVELVTICVEHTGGLRSLAECLDLQEPHSQRVPELLRLSDEWHAIGQFGSHDLRWLRGDLSRVPLTQEIRRQVAVWHSEPVPEYCRTVWHLFTHLVVAPPMGRARPPWLRLLDAVPVWAPDASHDRTQALIGTLAVEWAPLEAGEAAEAVVAAAPSAVGTAYLIIQFEKYGADEDTFIVSHWYQWASPVWEPVRGEDRHVRKGDLETAVDEIVLAAELRWADRTGPVAIEFVLPWELLNEPVDTWRKELTGPLPSPLTLDYQVVIRSLDRIRAEQWHRLWRGRWKTLITGTPDGDPVFCAAREQSATHLDAQLKASSPAVVLVLAEPPEPETTSERQLLIGMRAGIPAIVWHRRPPARPDLCESVRSTFSRGSISWQGVAQLPRNVAEWRQAAWSEDPSARTRHLGHGFVILWDDPERQPGRTGPAGGGVGKVRA